MPVTLVTGPVNAGKTAKCLDLLGSCDPGRTGTVVVPDRATAGELRRCFASRFKGSYHAIRGDAIQDWQGFVRTLASPTLPVASRQHSTLIVLGLLAKLKLPYFGQSARSYASAAGFSRTIQALKSHLITAEELLSIISGLGEARLRERDLIAVYEAYEKELTRLELLDEADLTLLAIRSCLEGNARLAAMQFVGLDEFTMPGPAQIAMLRALGSGLPRAAIVATCPTASSSEEERPFAEWLSRARDAWLSACDDEEELAGASATRPAVSVLIAGSPQQEARHAALLVAQEQLAAREIVVARKPDDTFLEWFLSEAHSLGLLPLHPTLDGARGSALAHELTSPGMLEQLPAEASIAEFAEKLARKVRVQERTRAWIAGLRLRRGHGRVAARSLSAAEAISDALRELATSAAVLKLGRIGREQFVQLLTDELRGHAASATILQSILPFRLHALGTPLAVECTRLVVPRMIEGHFPTRTGETLFFGDWKEEAIRRIFPDALDRHAMEAFAFETMLCKCRGPVTLLMPAVTDAGAETLASPFASRFLDEDAAPKPLGPCVLDMAFSCRTPETIEHLLAVEQDRIAGSDPQHSRFANCRGILASAEASSLVRRRFVENELSARALERYANCPFSFFAQHVLRTAEPLEETPQIRATDRGTLVHEVLASLYRDHAAAVRAAGYHQQHLRSPSPFPLPSRERVAETPQQAAGNHQIDQLVLTIAQEVWDRRRQKLGYVKPGLRERETREVAFMAKAVIAAEADEARHIDEPLTPRAFEWEFGRKQGSAIEIPVPGDEPLFICGRVDRIDADRDEGRFLVIDYKTGTEKKQIVGQIESGAHLQLPLYIVAAKQSLFPKALPLGGLLIEIKELSADPSEKKTPGKTKGLVLEDYDKTCYRLGRSTAKIDEARMDELLDAAQDKAAEFASLIRQGIFPASNEADCGYCNHGDICRHSKVSAD